MKTQTNRNHAGTWMWRLRYGSTTLLILALLLGLSWMNVRAAGTIVVGNGTPQSCTSESFHQAIADGGTVTFNCGPDPVTIRILDGPESITHSLTIDGGGLITFIGGFLFYIGNATTVEFMNLTLADFSEDMIGGISNFGTLTLHHITVENNSVSHSYGGGGIANGGLLTIEDSAIVGNFVSCNEGNCRSAGGITNTGTLRIVNSTVSGNGASFPGGGGLYNTGTATIENSTITGNSTGCLTYQAAGGLPYEVCYPGGGILNTGTLQVINSTIAGNSTGNSSGGSGGGIANYGALVLKNTTLAYNTAQSGGGLANYNAATLQNSILAGNTDVNQQPSDCSGPLISQGYNLIQDPGGCTIEGNGTGDLLGVDPLLGPLQDNGGPTLTRALLPGSPAIDAGNPAAPGSNDTACETADQRGVIRPQDGNGDGLARCDIGAVEVEPASLTVMVDIKPGDSTNPVNLKSRGVIPVAILSTSTFDAATVDPASVQFGPLGGKSVSSSLQDLNGDGRLDLMLHFRTQQTGIQPGNTQACLTGQTRAGVPIEGCDALQVVP